MSVIDMMVIYYDHLDSCVDPVCKFHTPADVENARQFRAAMNDLSASLEGP